MTATANTHKFATYERDGNTQNDYAHYRFFQASTGRFLKPDNIPGNLGNPQSWNMYAYVNNNPVNFNDPTGHLAGIGGIQLLKGMGHGLPTLPSMAAAQQRTVMLEQMARVMDAGFSGKAVWKAMMQNNLSPTVKAYTVSGGVGHAAITATLQGETLWWSHGGLHNWHGIGTYDNGKTTPYSEQQFIDDYVQKGETVKVYTLDLSSAQAIGVAKGITDRLDFVPKGEASARKAYEYRPLLYNCSESIMYILAGAGVASAPAWPGTWAMPMFADPYLSIISNHVDEYPAN